MYELLDINPKLKTDFFNIIAQTIPKKNWDSLLLVALKKSVYYSFSRSCVVMYRVKKVRRHSNARALERELVLKRV